MVTFCPTALFAVSGSTVGVTLVMVAGTVVATIAPTVAPTVATTVVVAVFVTVVRWGVEITVMALISAAGSTVVEMTATAAGLFPAVSMVVAFSVSICVPGEKPGSGCPKRRNAPSKSRRQTIATISARRGVKASERLVPTWAESATRVMVLSMRISIQPL